MPSFDDSARSEAPPEEVWKLLYDPARFPAWWVGVGSTTLGTAAGHSGSGAYTVYPEGYPDFPMPQELATNWDGRQVTVSCLVSDLCFSWRLEPVDGGAATVISVHVDIPDHEAHRLDDQRAVISGSLRRLARLATTTA